MPCYKPISAYRCRNGGSISFKHTESAIPFEVSCGQCIGCRLERSRQWATRMVHESQCHTENSFITLTYSPENLPADGSLNLQHFTKFMKRLRSRLAPRRIRFFHCGEYGEKFSRPHYHAIIFGYDFPDRVYYKTVNEQKYYNSVLLDSVWGLGYCVIGDVTFDSCAYVARYVVKKVTGDAALDHYWHLNEVTGELNRVTPEYCSMSLKPGIGAEWFKRFGDQVQAWDSVVMRGFEMRPPRFYEGLYDPIDLEAVKFGRSSKVREGDTTPERLLVREKVKRAQLLHLKRGYDNEG